MWLLSLLQTWDLSFGIVDEQHPAQDWTSLTLLQDRQDLPVYLALVSSCTVPEDAQAGRMSPLGVLYSFKTLCELWQSPQSFPSVQMKGLRVQLSGREHTQYTNDCGSHPSTAQYTEVCGSYPSTAQYTNDCGSHPRHCHNKTISRLNYLTL